MFVMKLEVGIFKRITECYFIMFTFYFLSFKVDYCDDDDDVYHGICAHIHTYPALSRTYSSPRALPSSTLSIAPRDSSRTLSSDSSIGKKCRIINTHERSHANGESSSYLL